MSQNDRAQRYADRKRESFLEQAAAVMEGLERIKQQVAREMTRESCSNMEIARQIIHSVSWGQANLDLSQLLAYAVEADDAARDIEEGN